mgnify:CR=1 FL=1
MVPLEWLADRVVFVAFVEPLLEVQADIFFRFAAADVDLVASLPPFSGTVSEVDSAVILAVLVNFVIQAEVEVLECLVGHQETALARIAELAAGDDFIFDLPLG